MLMHVVGYVLMAVMVGGAFLWGSYREHKKQEKIFDEFYKKLLKAVEEGVTGFHGFVPGGQVIHHSDELDIRLVPALLGFASVFFLIDQLQLDMAGVISGKTCYGQFMDLLNKLEQHESEKNGLETNSCCATAPSQKDEHSLA